MRILSFDSLRLSYEVVKRRQFSHRNQPMASWRSACRVNCFKQAITRFEPQSAILSVMAMFRQLRQHPSGGGSYNFLLADKPPGGSNFASGNHVSRRIWAFVRSRLIKPIREQAIDTLPIDHL